MKLIVDVDDLVERDQIERYLAPLRKAVSDFQLVAYAVPNRLGQVKDLAQEFPWIVFGQHGWEHTQFECVTWTKEQAYDYIMRARSMGYAPIFKAPNWVLHEEVEEALRQTDTLLHCHSTYVPVTRGLRYYIAGKRVPALHTHVLQNAATDFIVGHPGFKEENLLKVSEFLLPWAVAETVE